MTFDLWVLSSLATIGVLWVVKALVWDRWRSRKKPEQLITVRPETEHERNYRMGREFRFSTYSSAPPLPSADPAADLGEGDEEDERVEDNEEEDEYEEDDDDDPH